MTHPEADALARARVKLDALRSGDGRPTPTERMIAPLLEAITFLVLPAAGFCWLGVRMMSNRSGGAPWLGWVMFFIACLFGAAALRHILGTRPNTPRRSLGLFYRALAAGRAARARKLVVPGDLDTFRRFQPEVAGWGKPTGRAFVFESAEDFGDYWRLLLRGGFKTPTCIVRIRMQEVRELAPDLCRAEFQLQLRLASLLEVLRLVTTGILLWFMASDRMGHVVTADLSKILVRVGDEWHLFNGAWMGHEEKHPGWIS